MTLEDAIGEKVLKGVSASAFKDVFVLDGMSYSLHLMKEFKMGLGAVPC